MENKEFDFSYDLVSQFTNPLANNSSQMSTQMLPTADTTWNSQNSQSLLQPTASQLNQMNTNSRMGNDHIVPMIISAANEAKKTAFAPPKWTNNFVKSKAKSKNDEEMFRMVSMELASLKQQNNAFFGAVRESTIHLTKKVQENFKKIEENGKKVDELENQIKSNVDGEEGRFKTFESKLEGFRQQNEDNGMMQIFDDVNDIREILLEKLKDSSKETEEVKEKLNQVLGCLEKMANLKNMSFESGTLKVKKEESISTDSLFRHRPYPQRNSFVTSTPLRESINNSRGNVRRRARRTLVNEDEVEEVFNSFAQNN